MIDKLTYSKNKKNKFKNVANLCIKIKIRFRERLIELFKKKA